MEFLLFSYIIRIPPFGHSLIRISANAKTVETILLEIDFRPCHGELDG
jgi:hypothetical protein